VSMVTLNTVGPTLMKYGTEEQKAYFLQMSSGGSRRPRRPAALQQESHRHRTMLIRPAAGGAIGASAEEWAAR
ncbi:acyl-CoA dehydrogenase, partial [Streptomyces atratus]